MSSFFDAWANSGAATADARRHTVDHTGRATTNNTPSHSRSSSVGSNRSEPSWFSAYDGVDTTKARSDSTASRSSVSQRKSTKLVEKPNTSATSGWKALFNADDRKERKKKQKEADKQVLTSRHTAAVRSKLNERRKSVDGGSGTPSAHITAAQQEFRFPHSGPPAIHGGTKGSVPRKGKKPGDVTVDMPMLTRIISGDENDDEDENRARLGREEWVLKRQNTAMRRFTVAEGAGGEESSSDQNEENDEEEKLGGEVMEVDGTKVIGAVLEGDVGVHRAKPRGGMGAGWRRDETGKWTR